MNSPPTTPSNKPSPPRSWEPPGVSAAAASSKNPSPSSTISILDPMIDERTEKQQKSVDRARAQSHLILRRSLAELRGLQKVRTLKEQVADHLPASKPAPTSDAAPASMDALMNLAESQLAQRFRESGLSSFCNPVGQVPDLPSTKPVATPTHRRSSQKYPPERPLPLQVRRKIQKMLWRSGRRRPKTGRLTCVAGGFACRIEPLLHRRRPKCTRLPLHRNQHRSRTGRPELCHQRHVAVRRGGGDLNTHPINAPGSRNYGAG